MAQWADAHSGLAQAWVKADPLNHDFVDAVGQGAPGRRRAVDQGQPRTRPSRRPRTWPCSSSRAGRRRRRGRGPSAVEHALPDGTTEKTIEPVKEGTDIQSVFFDMWRQDHPDVALEDVPADMVMTSGSGLDPDITLENAHYQLDRVADAWAKETQRDPTRFARRSTDMLHAEGTRAARRPGRRPDGQRARGQPRPAHALRRAGWLRNVSGEGWSGRVEGSRP